MLSLPILIAQLLSHAAEAPPVVRFDVCTALAGAALLWTALPPLGLWPLGWIAPLGWVLLIRRREISGRRPYRTLWLVGFLFWLAAIHWLRLPHWLTGIGWVALSAYLAFYLPLLIALGRVAVHRLRVPLLVAVPVIFTGLELARAHVLTGFSMGSLAHTQYHWLTLIQVSDLGGEYVRGLHHDAGGHLPARAWCR